MQSKFDRVLFWNVEEETDWAGFHELGASGKGCVESDREDGNEALPGMFSIGNG